MNQSSDTTDPDTPIQPTGVPDGANPPDGGSAGEGRVTGVIQGDPLGLESWIIYGPEVPDDPASPMAEYSISNPLLSDHWEAGDYITLVVIPDTGTWVPSECYQDMYQESELENSTASWQGCIASDPYAPGWNLLCKPDDAGVVKTVTVNNELPPPAGQRDPSNPHRWRIGDYITLRPRLYRPNLDGWQPSNRNKGLAP